MLFFFILQLTYAGFKVWTNFDQQFSSPQTVVNDNARSDVSGSSTDFGNLEMQDSEYQGIMIPAGYALYYSRAKESTTAYQVDISSRTNSNKHVVYDISWSDGVETVFIFWANGDAEIITKYDGKESSIDTATYIVNSHDQTIVTAHTGSYSVFPGFRPVPNQEP